MMKDEGIPAMNAVCGSKLNRIFSAFSHFRSICVAETHRLRAENPPLGYRKKHALIGRA